MDKDNRLIATGMNSPNANIEKRQPNEEISALNLADEFQMILQASGAGGGGFSRWFICVTDHFVPNKQQSIAKTRLSYPRS